MKKKIFGMVLVLCMLAAITPYICVIAYAEVYYYNNSVVPRYDDVVNTSQTQRPLGYTSGVADITRYFYKTNEKDLKLYKDFLIGWGWEKISEGTGGDTRGSSVIEYYGRQDKFTGESFGHISLIYFPETGNLDISTTLNMRKYTSLLGDYKEKYSFVKRRGPGYFDFYLKGNKLEDAKLYMVIYDDNENIIETIQGYSANISGGTILRCEIPDDFDFYGKYKFFIWDGNMQPITTVITAF